MFSLNGKTAYVTGGLGLVGGAIFDALQTAGAETFALEPTPSDTSRAVLEFDASDTDAIGERLASLESRCGAADVWVNCAYPRTEDWSKTRPETLTAESWRTNVDLQMNSYCLFSTAVAEAMAARGSGSIINVASIYGVTGADFGVYSGTDMMLPPAYAAIKGGIVNYTRYLASYYGPKGVRVNTICPGGVADNQPQPFVDNYAARTPMRRMAEASELGGPVVFLASDAASYVTGAALMVDGGWTAI